MPTLTHIAHAGLATSHQNKKPEKMKKIPTSKILDKLHRGVVYTCIGLTLYGTALIGNRVYRYFSVVKPERAALELKMLEVKSCISSQFVA
jgi:Cytochrome oxidase c assembly